MVRRLRRVQLRPAHVAMLRRMFGPRHDQAYRRRTLAVPRVVLLLLLVVVAGSLLTLQQGNTSRAAKPWAWAPLPATAFGSLLPSGVTSPQPSDEVPAEERSLLSAPDGNVVWEAPAARGAEGAIASSSPATGPTAQDGSATPAQAPAGAAVTVRGGGPDAPSIAAVVQATPTPVPAPAPVRVPKGPIHVVAAGDNLWTIARRHSAPLTSILRWNESVNPDRLVAGQRILVPSGSTMKPLPKPAPVKTLTASSRSAAVDRPAAPQAQGGDHLWPLEVRGDLTRRFSSAHPGIDIAAPQGTRVRAIADGTVAWAGWKNNGGGYVVEIEHPDGMRSTYNHNSKLNVERGDTVNQGDTIALVGSTGWSTGPHLDIRIRMGGRLVDPLGLL